MKIWTRRTLKHQGAKRKWKEGEMERHQHKRSRNCWLHNTQVWGFVFEKDFESDPLEVVVFFTAAHGLISKLSNLFAIGLPSSVSHFKRRVTFYYLIEVNTFDSICIPDLLFPFRSLRVNPDAWCRSTEINAEKNKIIAMINYESTLSNGDVNPISILMKMFQHHFYCCKKIIHLQTWVVWFAKE